jgi:polysaccharide pyruvyl transferase WcaK-like protein
MKNLKVLHVASFTGNIGDNANHTGFRSVLQKNLNANVEYTEFEIRKVFWKQKFFDKSFVDMANIHDLVVIGGGNYFELWVDHSSTGTSIDISLDLLSKITSPVVFNALGVDSAQGASDIAVSKFRGFLDFVIDSESMLLSCRNDGSMKTLREVVGDTYADEFFHVPDAGFFTFMKDSFHPELDSERKNIVIQIAGDMLDVRFPNCEYDDISYEEFLESFAAYIVEFSKLNVNYIFVPHIFKDLNIISSLINKLPDNIRRECVAVAPYLVGQKGQDYIFDLYRKADLVLGMRFHANVCGLGLGKSCIGLVNYRQIEGLYDELKLNDLKVHVNKKGFEDMLLSLSERALSNSNSMNKNFLLEWRSKLDSFHYEINRILDVSNNQL